VTVSRLGPGRAAARLTLPLADLTALVGAAAISGLGGWRAAAFAMGACAAQAASGLDRLRICLRVFDQAGHIAAAVTVGAACVFPWTPVGQTGRLLVVATGLVLAFRAAAMAALRTAHRRGWLLRAVLLVGADETASRLTRVLRRNPELGLRPAGFLVSGPDAPPLPANGPQASGLPVLGQLADLGAVIARHGISRVIVCSPAAGDEGPIALVLDACRAAGADVRVVPPLPEPTAALPRFCVDEVSGIPLLPLRGHRRLVAMLALKRTFDLIAAAVLLVLIWPVLLTLAVMSRLQLRRPALFRQVRVVGSGGLAEIVKLRTLPEHGDPDTYWAPSGQQCTRFGWILRASHLDELPQLVNVLRGEMSLVGPRPERPYFARQFAQEIPGYSDRQRMPAGLTGWAQVHGLNGDTSIRDRVQFDNSYIECWSFWLDLVILARTVVGVVTGVFHPAAGNHPAQAARMPVTHSLPAPGPPDGPAIPAALVPSHTQGGQR
jgi:exopolysaccharide biosynthesis polyprenyl glycosylphosphotransferase